MVDLRFDSVFPRDHKHLVMRTFLDFIVLSISRSIVSSAKYFKYHCALFVPPLTIILGLMFPKSSSYAILIRSSSCKFGSNPVPTQCSLFLGCRVEPILPISTPLRCYSSSS